MHAEIYNSTATTHLRLFLKRYSLHRSFVARASKTTAPR